MNELEAILKKHLEANGIVAINEHDPLCAAFLAAMREAVEAAAQKGEDVKTLYKSWCETGDDNQKLIDNLNAIIQAWEDDEDIVINTGRAIREAQEYLKSRNAQPAPPQPLPSGEYLISNNVDADAPYEDMSEEYRKGFDFCLEMVRYCERRGWEDEQSVDEGVSAKNAHTGVNSDLAQSPAQPK